MSEDMRERYTEALYKHAVTVARPTPFPPAELEGTWLATVRENATARANAVMAVRDEEMGRLRAELASARNRIEALEANGNELKQVITKIEAERERTRQAEGATERDENVLNGVVNGLGVALRIARGER